MKNNKAKGSSYERKVAKFLTKWVSGEESPAIFWRQDCSGAIATNNNDNNFNGDIKVVDGGYKWFSDSFSIECKKGYPGFAILDIFEKTKKNILRDFWCQAVKDAKGKEPILIYSRPRKREIICISQDFYGFLSATAGFKLLVNHIVIRNEEISNSLKYPEQLYIYDKEEFFENIKIEHFKGFREYRGDDES